MLDYHNHPQGHRNQPYTVALLQPWVDSARAKGIVELAFTDHDRYIAGVNFDVIEEVRAANPDVKVRAGIELDNDPETGREGADWVRKNWDRLDFVLGSVHYLDRPEMFDSVGQDIQFEGKDINFLYEDYFRRVRGIIETGLVDCLAHLDLIKIHGHRPRISIIELVDETLDLIRDRGLSMEISTAGWRKKVGEQYPSVEIIKAAKAKGISFTLASDAHSSVQVAENYPKLYQLAKELGIREFAVYQSHQKSLLTVW